MSDETMETNEEAEIETPEGLEEPTEIESGSDAEGLDDDALDALEGDAGPPAETITIGGVEVPVAALSDLSDDVLRRIKRKVKAAGEEREISLIEALEAVPKAEGWQRRMWEASKKEKELEAIAKRMGSDHIGAYAALHGVSRREAMDALAAQYLREAERDAMSPEERAKAERQDELERKAKLAEEYERKEKERELEAQANTLRQQFMAATKPALTEAGLSASKRNVQAVAQYVSTAIESGIIKGTPGPDDFTWAAKEVAKEISSEREEYLSTDDADQLIERIGPERARKIAQAYAKRVRKAAAPVEREGAAPRRRREPARAQTWEEWQAEADRRMGIR